MQAKITDTFCHYNAEEIDDKLDKYTLELEDHAGN